MAESKFADGRINDRYALRAEVHLASVERAASMAASTSDRCTETLRGAVIPSRTRPPFISSTSTRILSPIAITSPHFFVSTSIFRSSLSNGLPHDFLNCLRRSNARRIQWKRFPGQNPIRAHTTVTLALSVPYRQKMPNEKFNDMSSENLTKNQPPGGEIGRRSTVRKPGSVVPLPER